MDMLPGSPLILQMAKWADFASIFDRMHSRFKCFVYKIEQHIENLKNAHDAQMIRLSDRDRHPL